MALRRAASRTWWLPAALVASAAVCAFGSPGPIEAAGGIAVYNVADSSWLSGGYPSMVLDAEGNPVFSYHEFASDDSLRVLHCNDPACAGADDTFSEVDVGAYGTGTWTSMQLDADGFPVVSYLSDETTRDLNVLHCNDPDCVGGDDSITSPQTAGNVGFQTALVLDDAGNPVIVHWNATDNVMNLVHCNDPLCAGNDESITTPDPASATWPASVRAILLDADGNPVIAYTHTAANYSTANLRILHCDDPDCAGGGESITTPDPDAPNGGLAASLVLDPSGNPVVSYHDIVDGELNVLRCNDADCSGGDESVTFVDAVTTECCATSFIALDNAGNPVVAYEVLVGIGVGDLRLLRCNDPNCAGGDDPIRRPKSGWLTYGIDMQLDDFGQPVIAVDDESGLGLIRCGDADCDFDGDGCSDLNEQQATASSEMSGGKRNAKNPHDYMNPTHDGENRIDDVLAVVGQYFKDDDDASPGQPPYEPGYNPDTDRTDDPNSGEGWDLLGPNGQQRIDDILAIIKQYFHDCA